MKLSELRPAAPKKARKRVGRGNGNNWGRTCGRGEKGQKSRSGYSRRPYFEGGQIPLIRRLPKRGFKSLRPRQYIPVNIYQLEKAFADGETVDVETLFAKGLISKVGDGIKILGHGELTKKLNVYAHAFSATAKQKIEALGGTVSIVGESSEE